MLRHHQIKYRWGPGHILHVTAGETSQVIHDLQEATRALGKLNLPLDSLTSTGTTSGPKHSFSRDAARAPEFVPLRPPAESYAAATT
ncbi:Hypothetical predicted protein [Pelobates cultripes]|uniref:Uncharacterized protein n=1 Tax=Pelobates cultripes TaxID=61616 RepID=A0AAD1T5H6_PELCU|nr:Hypothetical predicted protein [Pelobates cultripes]